MSADEAVGSAQPPLNLIEGDSSPYQGVTFPSLLSRVKALFMDVIVLLLVFTGTTLFIDGVSDIPDLAKGFIMVFMIYLYDPILTGFTGSTLGQKVMRLKVRRYAQPEQRISIWQAFARFLVKGSLGWISFFTVTSNPQKRAIHDLVCGSVVLYDR